MPEPTCPIIVINSPFWALNSIPFNILRSFFLNSKIGFYAGGAAPAGLSLATCPFGGPSGYFSPFVIAKFPVPSCYLLSAGFAWGGPAGLDPGGPPGFAPCGGPIFLTNCFESSLWIAA